MMTVVGLLGSLEIKLQHENVSILVAQPRRLFVLVQCGAVTFYAVCLHALDSSAGAQAVCQWWNETADITYRTIPRKATVLCGIDGNLRVRSANEPWIGQQVDPPGSSGTDETHLLRFVQQIHGKVLQHVSAGNGNRVLHRHVPSWSQS